MAPVLRTEPALAPLATDLISAFSSNHVATPLKIDATSTEVGRKGWVAGSEMLVLRHGRIPPSEIFQVRSRRGFKPDEIQVGTECVLIAVHADNPLESISVADLRSIYLGRIRNWKELGGEDIPIIAYGREAGSSIAALFMETVLDGLYTFSRMQVSPGDRSVHSAVARDRSGIGFGGVAMKADGVKFLKIRIGDRLVAPDETNAHEGTYPLATPIYIAVRPNTADPVLGPLTDWILTEKGQAVIQEAGKVPLPAFLRYR